MNFQIGLVKNAHQVVIHQYLHAPDGEKAHNERIVDISELEQEGLALLLLGPALTDEEKAPLLQATSKSFPLINLQEEECDLLASFEGGEGLLKKYSTPWALLHNIKTLEEIFPLGDHLRQLWSRDRLAFIEEFWALIKSNIAPLETTIYFHDVVRAEKEHEKDRLVWAKAIGASHGRHCEIVPCEDVDLMMLEKYKTQMTAPMDIIDADQDRAQHTWALSINKSPILVMMKVRSVGTLAISLFKALMLGLQSEMNDQKHKQPQNQPGPLKRGPLH